MNKKYLSLGLAVAVLLALFGMALQDPLRFPVINRAVTAVITPFAAATNAVGGFVDDTGKAMTTVESLQQENETLHNEINELRYANLAMADIYAENQRLREMLNYKNSHPDEQLVVAKVLGRAPGELRDSLYIDKGSEDGVQQDMAVVTPDGLVGLVDEAYASSARVMLVTSTRCNVGARILRANSRAVGIVAGRGGDNVPLLMEHLPREAEVFAGDVVVTSGYSQNHPSGIVIGTVKESSLDAAGLLRNATIEAAWKKCLWLSGISRTVLQNEKADVFYSLFSVVWHPADGGGVCVV